MNKMLYPTMLISILILSGCATVMKADQPSQPDMTRYVDTGGQNRAQLITKLKRLYEGKCTKTSLLDCYARINSVNERGVVVWKKNVYDKYKNTMRDVEEIISYNYQPSFETHIRMISAQTIYSVSGLDFLDKEYALQFYGLLESIYLTGK